MKTRIQAVAALLALALAAPVAAGPVQDTDAIHAYCVTTAIPPMQADQGRGSTANQEALSRSPTNSTDALLNS